MRAHARATRCIICLQLRQENARPSVLLPALSALSRITFAPLFHFARIGHLSLSLPLSLSPPLSSSLLRQFPSLVRVSFPFPSVSFLFVSAFRCMQESLSFSLSTSFAEVGIILQMNFVIPMPSVQSSFHRKIARNVTQNTRIINFVCCTASLSVTSKNWTEKKLPFFFLLFTQ